MKSHPICSILSLLPLSLALLSCSAVPNKQWDISAHEQSVEQAKATASRQGVIISQSAQKARLIRVSKRSPWLNDAIEVNYRNLEAKTAILAILEHRPVRFEVTSNGPQVKALPGAVSYREHLDAIAAQANWAYTVDKGVVTFSDWQLVNYPVDFILGDKKATLSLSGTLSKHQNANQNNLNTSSNSLDELTKMIQRIVDSAGHSQQQSQRKASFSVVKASNSILVSAPPNTQKQIRHALDSINHIAGRSIYLDFDIYTVDLNEQYQRAVDIDVLRQSGIEVSSKVSSTLSDAENNFMLQLNFPENDHFGNSQVLLKALASHGEASLVSQGTLLLKNNQVGNIQTSSLNRFVPIGVDDYQSNTPAYRESIVQVLPSILDEAINLHLVLSNSDVEPYLKSLTREPLIVSTNNSLIPQSRISVEIDSIRLGEQFVIPTQIQHGETLMIAGLTNRAYRDDKTRNQLMPIVGDEQYRKQARREIIIVMTAYLIG